MATMYSDLQLYQTSVPELLCVMSTLVSELVLSSYFSFKFQNGIICSLSKTFMTSKLLHVKLPILIEMFPQESAIYFRYSSPQRFVYIMMNIAQTLSTYYTMSTLCLLLLSDQFEFKMSTLASNWLRYLSFLLHANPLQTFQKSSVMEHSEVLLVHYLPLVS